MQTRSARPIFRPAQIVRLIASLLTAWLAAGCFIEPLLLRLSAALPAGILLAVAIRRLQSSRQLLLSREQFRWFLELLLTSLSAGATPERAICDALPGMSQMLGQKSAFLRALHTLDQQLQARRSLDSVLPQLARQIICPEAGYFFLMLPELGRTGSQMAPFVRQHLRMVSEQISLQQETKAETAQRRTEAILLAVMPFLMVMLLTSSFDPATLTVMQQPAGLAGLAVAGCLALTAGILTVSLLAFSPARPARRLPLPPVRRKSDRLSQRLGSCLQRVYRDWLPAAYSTRLLQILFDLDQQEPHAAALAEGHPDRLSRPDPAGLPDQPAVSSLLSRYFTRKIRLMAVSLLPAGLFCMAVPGTGFLALLLPVIVAVLQDQQVFQLRRRVLDDYQLAYPVLLNLLTALLQAGLSLHRSLGIAGSCLPVSGEPASGPYSRLKKDLDFAHRQIQAGQPVEQVLEKMITACPLPEAQAALLLLLRYEQSGAGETLQLLDMQSTACWSLYRSTTKKHLEQQSLRLLLPMTLDLAAVLATAMLPAVLSLQLL